MAKNKVCMLLYQYYYVDSRVQNYVTTLLDMGMEVHVICLRHEAHSQIHQDGLKIIEIPMDRKSKNRNYFFEYLKSTLYFFLFTTINEIKNGYRIIHIHNMPDFLVFAAVLPKILGCKLILDIHDPMPEFFLSKFRLQENSFFYTLLKIEEKISSIFADKVITANPNFKEALAHRGIPPHKITVVANVADPNLFNNHIKREKDGTKYILIFPGTLSARYGLDIPIRALPALIKTIPNILVRYIGPFNEYTDELNKLAVELKVEDHFEIIDLIPLEEVPQYLASAHIGIYPALTDPHMSIATPGKVLEYVAMNLPVVASKLKALTVFFPADCITYFETGNTDEFTRCIIRLYEHPQEVEELLKNTQKKYIEKYTFEKEQAKYRELLSDWLK